MNLNGKQMALIQFPFDFCSERAKLRISIQAALRMDLLKDHLFFKLILINLQSLCPLKLNGVQRLIGVLPKQPDFNKGLCVNQG